MYIDRGMDKEDVVHIYNGILLSHKKWNNAIYRNMDGPRDYNSKWSKSDREHTCVLYPSNSTPTYIPIEMCTCVHKKHTQAYS